MFKMDRDQYRRIYGPTVGDHVILGDSGLSIEVTADDTSAGDEILGGCGKTWRDGFYSKSRESDLDMLVSNVVLIDPVLGIRKTSIGIKDGRVVGIGSAGSPDVLGSVDLAVGPHTVLIPGEGLIATPGAIDSHVHLASPKVLEMGLSSGITTMVGMGIGGVMDVGVNPARHIHLMMSALQSTPINMVLLARGSTTDKASMEAALEAGAGGFKVHEDYGASPECVDACLDVAQHGGVAVALHSDTLNEFGLLADTVSATRGRTVHAYHVEGGGGHPDLLEILNHPHVLGSSTTPTIPYATHTAEELFWMTMTVHRQVPDFAADIETTIGRVHEAGIQAENFLHHLGAIPIINSDSLGCGRIGEVLRRCWQLAGHPSLKPTGTQNDNDTVLKFMAKITINPALAHGLAQHVGSLEPGKLADLVLWDPAWFGAKPELVLKSGFVVWGAAGQGNGSTRVSQPRVLGPYFGSLGQAPSNLAVTFVAEAAISNKNVPSGSSMLPVAGARGVMRADMVRNTAVPSVVVPPDGSPVEIDGRQVVVAPLDRVPFGQASFLA